MFLLCDNYEYILPCTVFYASNDTLFIAGSNEDWIDSDTWFYLIPSEDGRYAWIKFCFAGGFPQGGMNEKGLFWDATGCPYLAMPYSETHKIKYNGPLMQKVIEECCDAPEALEVLANYYCEDQYRAQYLIGDASGNSAIIEGDSIIIKSRSYQVITNFYHSAPELGGFPCLRYETAVSMLQSNEPLSLLLAGKILSATHQNGKYPTQYSNTYDLKNRIIYLFHNHNFDEFVKIDLKSEMKDPASFKMSHLFSGIKIISPEYNQTLYTSSVTFRWEGLNTSLYELRYSMDPEFNHYESIPVAKSGNPFDSYYYCLISLIGFILLNPRIKKRYKKIIIPLIVIFILIGCSEDIVTIEPETGVIKEYSITVENLNLNSEHYWKVCATNQNNTRFNSESVTYIFHTYE